MSRASTSSAIRPNYNVCLICGSHTDLVLNIFEPRCGPNIVEIIYAKFKFKAEKSSADKFICYDCNNWLINWFSLQNKNEASERKVSEVDSTSIKEPTNQAEIIKIERAMEYEGYSSSSSKENFEEFFGENIKFKVKKFRKKLPLRRVLQKSNKIKRSCVYCKLPSQHLNYNQFRKHLIKRKRVQQTGINKKQPQEVLQVFQPQPNKNSSQECFFDQIRMLRKQGTELYKENDLKIYENRNSKSISSSHNLQSNDIILNFNSVITEVYPLDLSKYEIFDNHCKDIFNKIPKSLTISLMDERKDFLIAKKEEANISFLIE